MRDEERINNYYRFGTVDSHSELLIKRNGGKKNLAYRLLRPIKLAALLWIEILRNGVTGEKK